MSATRRPSGPDFSLEQRAGGLVAGLDEAGRGAWAGPVVAAIAVLDPGAIPPGINDSKRLTPAARAALYEALIPRAWCATGSASIEEIDQLNILQASLLAMRRAYAALLPRLPGAPALALIDGNQFPALPCPMRCIIGGDGRSLSIAAASIIAKVTRDRLMQALAQDWPHYGWAENMGYGTKRHQAGLQTHGATPHHRLSFAPLRAYRAA